MQGADIVGSPEAHDSLGRAIVVNVEGVAVSGIYPSDGQAQADRNPKADLQLSSHSFSKRSGRRSWRDVPLP